MTQPEKKTPGQVNALNQAARLLKGGDIDAAMREVKALLESSPGYADAHHLLALCHARARSVGPAEEAFKAAIRLAPGLPEPYFNYARLLRSVGRIQEARAALRQTLACAPTHAEAWLDLGLLDLSTGNTGAALEAVQKALHHAPDSAPAWHAMGSIRRRLEDLPGAEAAFRRSLEIAPGQPGPWVNLGAIARLLGRPEEALGLYGRARALGFISPELDDAEAGALLDLGRVDEAVTHARALVEKHPRFPAGHATLANLLWEHGPNLGLEGDPCAALLSATARYPEDGALRSELVTLLLEAGRPDEALHHVRMLRQAADRPELARLEADALEALGQSAHARDLYEHAIRRLGMVDVSLLNAYTRHLLKARDVAAAARVAQQATMAAPRNQESWAYLATAWRLLGDGREGWLCDYDALIARLEIETPEGFADVPEFLGHLKATLGRLHVAGREPMRQSLRGGSQTPGRLFGRDDPVIGSAQQALQRAVERWLATKTPDPTHPFLAHLARRIRFSGSWSVQLKASGRHVNHIHSQGWMSSAFYVSLPASVLSPQTENSQAGCIVFGQPPEELGLGLPPKLVVHPTPGQLVLFPSYMWHGTLPFSGEEPRLTIAFDMVPA